MRFDRKPFDVDWGEFENSFTFELLGMIFVTCSTWSSHLKASVHDLEWPNLRIVPKIAKWNFIYTSSDFLACDSNETTKIHTQIISSWNIKVAVLNMIKQLFLSRTMKLTLIIVQSCFRAQSCKRGSNGSRQSLNHKLMRKNLQSTFRKEPSAW